MSYADLLRQNPWWTNKNSILQDKHIALFNAQLIKHSPEFNIKPGIHIIRGPRQVGKTTLAKLRIRELLESKTRPESIFYYSFELSKTFQEVYDTVLEYYDAARTNGRHYLFLDEMTSVTDWSKAVKALWDQNLIKENDFVLVTGSSAVDLKKGSERLPGRKIEGNEYYYLPLSFRAYLKLKNIELNSCELPDSRKFYQLAQKNKNKILLLNKELENYLNHGGFLYSINHGKTELTLERYARWLEGDFVKCGKNPLLIKEVLQAIIKKGCSQFSYHSIAKETSIASHNTVIDYIEMASEELFLKQVNKVTLNPFKIERKKEKKAFFLDPVLIAIAEHWAEKELPKECKLEHILASHLSRIGQPYFYNDGRKEIDCIIKSNNKIIGTELKWSNNIRTSDTYSVKKTSVPFVLSKETLKFENNVPVIPFALFLAMLEIPTFIKRNVLKL